MVIEEAAESASIYDVFNALQDAVYLINSDLVILDENPAAALLLGYGRDELKGCSIEKLIPEHLLSEHAGLHRSVLEGKRITGHQTYRLSKDGTECAVIVSYLPLATAGKAISQVAEIVRFASQISDSAHGRGMLAAIVDSSEDAIISKTLDGVIATWNESASRLFGYTEQEAIGKPITILLPGYRLHEEEAIIASGKLKSPDYRLRRVNKEHVLCWGNYLWASA